MNASIADDDGREQPIATNAKIDSATAPTPSPAANVKVLIAGILLAVAGAWIAANLADRLRLAEKVERGVKYAGKVGDLHSTTLDVGRATRNAATAYALVGGILSLILGVIAGCFLGPLSNPRVFAAGIVGSVLGSSLGAASSYALTPIYFHRMGTADVTLSLLIHLGIWTTLGAAAGVAFGVGSGSRDVLVRSLLGGITGAALGTLLFDISGAFFPLARTERPLSEEAGTRLAANIVLCLCVVSGVVIVALQKTRVTTTNDT
jgi:MFS family permease